MTPGTSKTLEDNMLHINVHYCLYFWRVISYRQAKCADSYSSWVCTERCRKMHCIAVSWLYIGVLNALHQPKHSQFDRFFSTVSFPTAILCNRILKISLLVASAVPIFAFNFPRTWCTWCTWLHFVCMSAIASSCFFLYTYVPLMILWCLHVVDGSCNMNPTIVQWNGGAQILCYWL